MSDAVDNLPRMVLDGRRAWIASLASLLGSLPVSLAYSTLAASFALPVDGVTSTLVSLLSSVAVAAVVYEVLTWRAFARFDGSELRRVLDRFAPRTEQERRRESRSLNGPRAWAVAVSLASLAAVGVLTLDPRLDSQPFVVVLTLLTVAAGWSMIVFAWAIIYARMNSDAPGQLVFPGGVERLPVWRDYFYLSVQVSTTFASSDVDLLTTRARSQVTAQSLFAFIYNSVIVAVLVSVLFGPS